jgi:hypothetical protein
MTETLSRQNSQLFLSKFLHASILSVSPGYCQKALVDGSEMIGTKMDPHYIREWSHCLGRLLRYHPLTVKVTVEDHTVS